MVFEDKDYIQRINEYYSNTRQIISDLVELKFLEGLNLDNALKSNRYTMDYISISLFIDAICDKNVTLFARQCFCEAMFSSYSYFMDNFEDLTVDLYISFMKQYFDKILISPTLHTLGMLTELDDVNKSINISNLMNIEVDTNFKDESLYQVTSVLLINFTKEITKLLIAHSIGAFIEEELLKDLYPNTDNI